MGVRYTVDVWTKTNDMVQKAGSLDFSQALAKLNSLKGGVKRSNAQSIEINQYGPRVLQCVCSWTPDKGLSKSLDFDRCVANDPTVQILYPNS